ncbi:uncharacterized protein VTP21DRAFT_6712 [Calcarisporiella thermophila]|uniref:uncharacterized protein n=1 Tax=Calcarisporiella thermophila TaxID=911321 RepID=UPI003743B57F
MHPLDPAYTCLLIVDLQHDFLEGGALAVPDSLKILQPISTLLNEKEHPFRLIVATQDWHPLDHVSFAKSHHGKQVLDVVSVSMEGREEKQVLWPIHCVQETHGAEISSAIDVSRISHFVKKGTHSHIDSYSGFADNAYTQFTSLPKLLFSNQISNVVVVGLALDYCVRATCIDARKFGFRTVVVRDGTKAVRPDQAEEVEHELVKKGVEFVSLEDLIWKKE